MYNERTIVVQQLQSSKLFRVEYRNCAEGTISMYVYVEFVGTEPAFFKTEGQENKVIYLPDKILPKKGELEFFDLNFDILRLESIMLQRL